MEKIERRVTLKMSKTQKPEAYRIDVLKKVFGFFIAMNTSPIDYPRTRFIWLMKKSSYSLHSQANTTNTHKHSTCISDFPRQIPTMINVGEIYEFVVLCRMLILVARLLVTANEADLNKKRVAMKTNKRHKSRYAKAHIFLPAIDK